MKNKSPFTKENLPEILCISSYPPRECGIATYSQDLMDALKNKFGNSFKLSICALERQNENLVYPKEVNYVLETDNSASYSIIANTINENNSIQIVLVQHEFGLFRNNETDFISFLQNLNKPIIIAFHTVLPKPNEVLKNLIISIDDIAKSIIVMTKSSSKILTNDYGITADKIAVIPHGTHLVEHLDKSVLKEKYELTDRKVLATFGLLSSGKCIETTISALRIIVKRYPDILFLVIGKTHPTVIKEEGERYRDTLEAKIKTLNLQRNVKFINQYIPLPDLLEYLQLTDIYLFTSKDRNQAVSGTFSYALSCGCPIISTPIPHATEVLQHETGIIVDFENPKQLARKVIELIEDDALCATISANGIHKLAPSAWENSAIAHAFLFDMLSENAFELKFKIPKINLNHIKNLTTDFGMIQFSVINQPDLESGYTLDDNARALVAICKQYESTKEETDLGYIKLYFSFIKYCLHDGGYFLNYVDKNGKFTKQNSETNLSDSNGRAIWALGYLISNSDILPEELIEDAKAVMKLSLSNVSSIHSPRAMAFIIKGIFYSNANNQTASDMLITKHLADKLVQMYKHEANEKWQWFESYLTYGNSILSEAMLCAYLTLGTSIYKEIAIMSFDFLLTKIFTEDSIKVISNKGWMHNGDESYKQKIGGEQPIDVAYTILALSQFYDAFGDEEYLKKMKIAFNWFLGKNHLNQIVYNPCTGGCYDGLEEDYVNLNQGAESTVSYLMARLTLEKYAKKMDKTFPKKDKAPLKKNLKSNKQLQKFPL
ncbi:glycosyltransferase [Flavobacterium sp. AS60]|uniref:glycosyltransferase n=1 Tax=Flavobacterium anseongense TaxID=2910677 RepID=UPI001F1F17BF|nr:glycosyltransferase [Flavobacterium sp. AS60]MCF6129617.1 glycosyltransferase [Flavobacterium sp. AS60]